MSAAPAGAAAQAQGTGKPPAGTGMNTAAAFDNPLCRKDAGPYGRTRLCDSRAGVPCVSPSGRRAPRTAARHPGRDQGLDQDRRARPQRASNSRVHEQTRRPTDQRDRADGHGRRARSRTPLPRITAGHQTYGRTIDLDFVTSSGDDEAAQRRRRGDREGREAVPVIDGTFTSEPVFGTDLAAARSRCSQHDLARIDAEASALSLGPDRRERRSRSTPPNSSASNSSGKRRSTPATRRCTATARVRVIYGTPVTNIREFDKARPSTA